ncbi:CHAT domain-containing protein [Candidatus Gracilibacteria bacterium]|nr:CHAT domain-containing protein [Candidatus Gracilibacteria bacterium]
MIPTPLLALAVLGPADLTALRALLPGCTAESVALLDYVELHEGRWVLDQAQAIQQLAELASDARLYRSLHEQALAHFAARLLGEPAYEANYMAAFERLGNWLLTEDPAALPSVVDKAYTLALSDRNGQQVRTFFRAMALRNQDRYQEAVAVFDNLLAMAELDEVVRGRALNSRANCMSVLGRPEEAAAGLRAALAIWQRRGNRLRAGLAQLNLGINAYDLQQYDDAETQLLAAQEAFAAEDAQQWLAAARNELGLVYRDQGRLVDALEAFTAAAERYREGGTDSLSRVLNNIGEVYLFQGRFAEAEQTFRDALAAMQTQVHRIDVFLNLGLCHEATGNPQTAQVAFQQALDLALAIERRDILAEVYYRLGSAQQRSGVQNTAYSTLVAAAEVVEATREPLRDEAVKISLLGRWQQIYEALILHCLAQGRIAEAFSWAERARARAFADLVTRAGEQEVAFKSQHSEAARLAAIEHQEPTSENQEARDNNEDATRSAILHISELQAELEPGEALVSYFTTGVYERTLPLFSLLANDHPLRAILLTPATLLCFIITAKELRLIQPALDPNLLVSQSVRGEERKRFLRAPMLHQLQRLLIEPLKLAAMRRVLLAPHSPLHRVPFAALLNVPWVIVPSASFWLKTRTTILRRQPAVDACLAIGYDGASEGYALRHTEAEARFVATQTGGRAWVGPAPKLPQLRTQAATARWLHIACHGSFDERTPLASYLATGSGERLTALDVLRDWHLNADLTVLSTCQSGVSRVVAGDEPLGLIRAFLAAGTRAVLVSQWPIEDLPTFLLMQRFYALLAQQPGDPAGALYTAQRWLATLSSTDAHVLKTRLRLNEKLPDSARPFADPTYWAAFVLVGGGMLHLGNTTLMRRASRWASGTRGKTARPQASVSTCCALSS